MLVKSQKIDEDGIFRCNIIRRNIRKKILASHFNGSNSHQQLLQEVKLQKLDSGMGSEVSLVQLSINGGDHVHDEKSK